MIEPSKQQANTLEKQSTLSKSRFKHLIDQIQIKINKLKKPSDYLQSSIISSNINSFVQENKRSRILPHFIKNNRNQGKNKNNEKKISVNLEFNKLFFTQKRKFVQHYPNDKDLVINLPQIKIESKTHGNFKRKQLTQKGSPRWRHNPQLTQKLILLTQTNQYELFKVWKKQKQDQYSVVKNQRSRFSNEKSINENNNCGFRNQKSGFRNEKSRFDNDKSRLNNSINKQNKQGDEYPNKQNKTVYKQKSYISKINDNNKNRIDNVFKDMGRFSHNENRNGLKKKRKMGINIMRQRGNEMYINTKQKYKMNTKQLQISNKRIQKVIQSKQINNNKIIKQKDIKNNNNNNVNKSIVNINSNRQRFESNKHLLQSITLSYSKLKYQYINLTNNNTNINNKNKNNYNHLFQNNIHRTNNSYQNYTNIPTLSPLS